MSGDLISRKDLIETERLLMTDIVKNNEVARNILEQVLHDISHVPTAFNHAVSKKSPTSISGGMNCD